jgi:energy-coupling factor transporter ATP-binding protein EcfA2
MNSIDLSLNPNETVNPFSTLMEMRVAHSELLQHSQDAEDNGTTNQLLPEIELFLDRGQKTGVLLDREDDRLTARGLLDYWRAILYRWGHRPSAVNLADFDISLAPELANSLCPYRGLEAFQEKDCELFYGRQRLVDQLLQELQENRLLAVVGSSGSGKSSVVLGGLIPSLKAGKLLDSQNWHYYGPMVPGSDPLENLARLFYPECDDKSGSIEQKAQKFIQNSSYLTELLNHTDNQPSVLVIDQFEEIFQLCLDVEKRQAFISNLLEIIQFPEISHRVILTMRSDLEYRVTKFSAFDSLFKKGRVAVVFLGANELREVIKKPAELVGLKFEEGLVDKLIQDFLGEDEVLPLLQFTLLKLWEKRERNRISMKAYINLGRGRLALPNIAEDLYVNHFNPQDRVTCKRIFLKMVQPTEGKDFTSRRILCRDLYQVEVDREDVESVLNKLINKAHLVKFTKGDMSKDAQVEVAHEALIRNWPRLVDWLEDERVNLRNRLQLTAKAKEWDTKGRIEGALLRGKLLKEAEQTEDLNDLEKEFIRVSQDSERRSQVLKSIFASFGIFGMTVIILSFPIIAWSSYNYAKQQNAVIEEKLNQNKETLKNKTDLLATQEKALVNKNLELKSKTELLATQEKALVNKNLELKSKTELLATQEKAVADKNLELQKNKELLATQKLELQSTSNKINTIKQKQTQDTRKITDILDHEIIDPLRNALKSNETIGRKQIDNIILQSFKIRAIVEEGNVLAKEYEIKGFEALVARNLKDAKDNFNKAYKAGPTYHSVDEINKLLTPEIVQKYEDSNTSDSSKKQIINEIYKQIVDQYYRGATPEQLKEMKKSLGL